MPADSQDFEHFSNTATLVLTRQPAAHSMCISSGSKKPIESFPHTGAHVHELGFQMFYILKRWIRFAYEDQGKFTFGPGDSCLQPPGIVHGEIDCLEDLELIEFASFAEFKTRVIARPLFR